MTFLSKIWYLDNECRFPAIITKEQQLGAPYLSIMVFYGGVWENVLASPETITDRTEDWSDKMFDFRHKTMEVPNLKWHFKDE